uniref:Putative tick til 21 n=1 Tax=Amblyomma triste TaxID=251400 RepID=A0A023G3W2_AMBTT
MRILLVLFAVLLVLVISAAAVRYPLPVPKPKPPKRPVPKPCGFWGAAQYLNKCGKNEECRRGLAKCGERKCWLANRPGGRPYRCAGEKMLMCFCKPGYWRSSFGKCVTLRNCFKK